MVWFPWLGTPVTGHRFGGMAGPCRCLGAVGGQSSLLADRTLPWSEGKDSEMHTHGQGQ